MSNATHCRHGVLLGFHCNYCEREQQEQTKLDAINRGEGTRPIGKVSFALPFDLKGVVSKAIKSVESRPDYVMRPNHAQHRFNVVQYRLKSAMTGRGTKVEYRWKFVIDTAAFQEYSLSYIASETLEELNECDFIQSFTFSEAVKYVESMKALPQWDGYEWIIAGFVEVWR